MRQKLAHSEAQVDSLTAELAKTSEQREIFQGQAEDFRRKLAAVGETSEKNEEDNAQKSTSLKSLEEQLEQARHLINKYACLFIVLLN